jgi:hypothetical protein
MLDLLALAGAACVVAGAYLVSPPLALIAAGLVILVLVAYVEAARVDRRTPPG